MNRRLAVVAFVMLVLTGAMGLRNALGSQSVTANGSSPVPVMVAKDGGAPLPQTPWAKDGGCPLPRTPW